VLLNTKNAAHRYKMLQIIVLRISESRDFITLALQLTGDAGPHDRISHTGNPYYRCKLIAIGTVTGDTKKL